MFTLALSTPRDSCLVIWFPSQLVTLCSVLSLLSHRSCVLSLSCAFSESWHSHSCIYSVIHAPHSEINTSHKVWMLYHLHTYSISCSYTFVLDYFLCVCDSFLPNGWHCDYGCHTTHAVFSKTAEDSPAHVTTASRLACYHGDKPANENSADGCNVDCKLFVLRGDLFFFSLSPPSQLLRRRPHYSGTCARAHR